jgi:hypothetical protein
MMKCSKNAHPDARREMSEEDARLLLEKMDCVAYLGGGTFGTAFETGAGDVVKFIPQRRSKGRLPCNASQEFSMQRKFARRGLAWAPLGLRHFSYNAEEKTADDEERSFSALRMPKVTSTLDKLLHGDGAPRNAAHAAALGASLARLVSDALAAGMVHHDAKCNNVGVSDEGVLRFIDFGRSFDEPTLNRMGATSRRAERVVRLGAALDAWRLQDSVTRRMLWQDPGEDFCDALIRPLRTVALTLLKKARAVSEDFFPDALWWKNQKVFANLKETLSSHLKRLSGRQ